ncbi:metallophosphoesterase family protein [Clostridium sp. D2Q-11]|uniref:Metallophosphoesterase family protein n=1 Tax=Anaeromonas frigoriresistens TaxID=2683708 RepID=A0A942UTB7_9FIRM|nr:metallophosphoesterase [Anaeromonas frigoriresistens]MBS4538758.1 metallophosphoesterase family protein [Anaeromonas frigoriresistens]
MYGFKHLSELFKSAERISYDNSSKIVLMSDCHRGDGSWADTFFKNQNIYFTALTHYYNENYTYIEIGDGDELWENNTMQEIIRVHKDIFWILSEFYKKDRLYFIYGNHDMVKKDEDFIKNNLYYYFDQRTKEYIPLFKNINIHEGLVLKHKDMESEIFLVHGHQIDYMNDKMWRLRRFLVKYLWRPLEIWGVNDPTSPAKDYEKKKSVGQKLTKWVIEENQMMICGHTHRSVFPETHEPPYFNDGSCVHPRGITAIEIIEGNIMLVKWEIKTKKDGTLFVGKKILAGPIMLKEYFNSSRQKAYSEYEE